jgi:hypothetical protein
VKNELNILHVVLQQQNVKTKVKVKLGVKQNNMIKLINILKEAKKSKETFEEFAKTRGEGAAKIAANAEEKGGLSLLTWHHFKVKAPYYKKATEGKFDEEFGIPLIETAKPAHVKVDDFDDVRQVGYRGCYWFFNTEGFLIKDDVGLYSTFEEAIDTLFDTYKYVENNIDKKGFKTYKG